MCSASCCDPNLIYLINKRDLILQSQLGFPREIILHPGTLLYYFPLVITFKGTRRDDELCTSAHQISRSQ